MKIEPKRLPLKVFLNTFKYVPRVAVSLIIVNKESSFLLSLRAIEPCKGEWHLPGSFILKGETIYECVRRVAKTELALNLSVKNLELVGAFDNLNKDPRGHVIDLVYRVATDKLPKQTIENTKSDFFKKIPKNIAFSHGSILKKAGY